MLFAVDIGNTNIVLTIMENYDVIDSWRITTTPIRTQDEYEILIKAYFLDKKYSIEMIRDVAISSVVPSVQTPIKQAVEKIFNKTVVMITGESQHHISIKLDNPKEIGSDLIATAAGAKKILPNENIIVIDCGTATKVTVVTKENEFLGGAIAPGLEIAAQSLSNSTAALPQVALKFPTHVIGTNTIDAIASGQMYGYVGLIKELVKQVKKQYANKKFTVIATGGYMALLKDHLSVIDYYEPNLIFTGIAEIVKQTKKEG